MHFMHWYMQVSISIFVFLSFLFFLDSLLLKWNLLHKVVSHIWLRKHSVTCRARKNIILVNPEILVRWTLMKAHTSTWTLKSLSPVLCISSPVIYIVIYLMGRTGKSCLFAIYLSFLVWQVFMTVLASVCWFVWWRMLVFSKVLFQIQNIILLLAQWLFYVQRMKMVFGTLYSVEFGQLKQ